jgi:thioredoxin reductase (NADPH)
MGDRPILLVVHDDPDVRGRLGQDLGERFGGHYDIEAHADATSALNAALAHAGDGAAVAAGFIADTAESSAMDFGTRLRELHPLARRILIVGRGEWRNAHPAVEAIRTGQAESYLFVPWGPRERWLYLPVTEVLADWEAAQPPPLEIVQIVGEEREPRAHRLRETFARIGIPLGFYSPDSDQGRSIRAHAPAGASADVPLLAFTNSGTVLADPSHERIAQSLGFSTAPERSHCDLAIIGAGPAGLTAAVYGASEGLAAVLIDPNFPGGQAGTSSRIRNYLGFPTGISGRDLANRALEQAWFFGARIVLARRATALEDAGVGYRIALDDGSAINARTAVIATGVEWRRLDVPGLDDLLGSGVFYGAGLSDPGVATGSPVFIVGAGNSAGQAAVHLAAGGAYVTLVARGASLAASMSDYLVDEVTSAPSISVRLNTEVVGVSGRGRLTGLTLRDRMRDTVEQAPADALYIMIGAHPHTEWLDGVVERDAGGYILTGSDVSEPAADRWPLDRPPMLQETSLPGVFAAGDVRHGSIKRVASAVGAGSIAVQLAHLRLAELDE